MASPGATSTEIIRPPIGAFKVGPVIGAESDCSFLFESTVVVVSATCDAWNSSVRRLRKKPFATLGRSSRSSISSLLEARLTFPSSGIVGFIGFLYDDTSYGFSIGLPVIFSRNAGSTGTGVWPYSPLTRDINWLDGFE
jgi:hypothetical protein